MQIRMKLSLSLCILMALSSANTAQSQDNGTDPTDIIAAQVRSQGYECKMPKPAVADPDASTAEDKVWILTCEDAEYRVRLIPDMAADIEQVN